MTMRRALISVSNKEGVAEAAKGLLGLGFELISTGGTAKLLRERQIPVRDISEITGFPEMLDGRVKTLHPKVHGGLLGRRRLPEHVEQMRRHGIEPIDVVIVNLYPFEATINKPGCTFDDAIENIDIGGPSMLRSAAKNFEEVAVVVDPADYPRLLDELAKPEGLSRETRLMFARKVFAHTSKYDGLIASYLERQAPAPAASGEAGARFPDTLSLRFEKVQNLRYGENPHQQAAFYRDPSVTEACLARARQLHGKEMSYNNFLDAHAALELVKEFDGTAVVIVKHNNPCGVALGASPAEAYRKAREGDPISAFGGVAAFNRPVDAATAKEIGSTFMEVIVAPGFEPEAVEELGRKKALRLLDVGPLGTGSVEAMDLRKVVGGLLYQDRDLGAIADVRALRVVSRRPPTDEEYQALAFTWKVAKHTKSNAIVYGRADRTVGVGAGQMSRVDSVKLGAMKAVLPLGGTAIASDAFFPFPDGIHEAAKAGVTAVIQPGGSVKDDEVIAAANEHDMAMILTGMRHFRH
ncbi:MAG: bifunctional phosphoribosylaminoimidazolecarboxamide formyltransferase/IMP cyclohydrolase [Nitrospiria bacterium]